MDFDLEIRPIDTNKSKIKKNTLMKKNIIPCHPASVIFNGSSGSGKSTLLLNLLTRKEFYKGYFHEIYLFSPTGSSDDLFSVLNLKKSNIFLDLNPKDLEKILEKQRKVIEARGIQKAKRVLLIFEDCQSNYHFVKSKPFLKSFIANRHYGVSTFLCGQSWTKTPRACRLQAFGVFYFRASGSENEKLAEEFCPPGMSKRQFISMIEWATKEKHSFLFINNKVPHEQRYRKKLTEIINWK